MSNILRMHPFIFNYKSIMLNITENEDENIILELTSRNMIHTSYIPASKKGNKLQAKVILNSGESIKSKDTGVNMHVTINADYGWFLYVNEDVNGLTLDFYTGNHQLVIDQTIKTINHNNMYSLMATFPK